MLLTNAFQFAILYTTKENKPQRQKKGEMIYEVLSRR